MDKIIYIRSEVLFQRPGAGGSFRPFRDHYHLAYEGWEGDLRTMPDGRVVALDHKGLTLGGLRKKAQELAATHGAVVIDESKKRV